MSTRRLYVFCEGPTEQRFCDRVLQRHLFPDGNGLIHTLAVGERDHAHLFGLGRGPVYQRVRRFINRMIKSCSNPLVYFTTLFDTYAIPSDFPGLSTTTHNPAAPHAYAVALEQAFGLDINHSHFIPHLQLYEYETILFADPNAFEIAFEGCANEVAALRAIVESVPSIEHIDGGRLTAPSKRIIGIFPEYDGRKTTAGVDIADYISLSTIRAACPHVDGWLKRLETIPW